MLPFENIAQPEVSNLIIPEFGDSIHLIKCMPADFQENAFGANQNWDFSGLTGEVAEPDYFFKFLDPQSTLHGDRYPDSELAAINADTQYVYYNMENGVLQLIGAVSEQPGFGTAFADYDNEETEEVFPIAFENTWSDNFDGLNVLGGFSAPFNGTVEGEVDGYGTLILPSGTFDNVLRIKEERTYTVSGSAPTSSMMYRYVSADYNLWLLSMESFPSGPPLIYYRDTPIIISSNSDLDFSSQIQLMPNPVSVNDLLYIKMGGHTLQAIQVYDVNGRGTPLEFNANSNSSVELKLPKNLSSGHYIIQGVLGDGIFSKKIIIVD